MLGRRIILASFVAALVVAWLPLTSAVAQDGPDYVGTTPAPASAETVSGSGSDTETVGGGWGVLPITGAALIGLIALGVGLLAIGRVLKNRRLASAEQDSPVSSV